MGIVSINRIRANVFGGENLTFSEWDSNFNYAKDSSGDEVTPRTMQSPNLELTPTQSFLDLILSLGNL